MLTKKKLQVNQPWIWPFHQSDTICYRQVYALQVKIKFCLNLSCPNYSWIIRARSLRKNDNQPTVGWKILQKKKLKFLSCNTCTWQISFVKWLFSALQKTPNFIGQGQILIVTEFPQVFDLGADGKGTSYVASLTQDRITQRAASTARYEYFILLSHFALWWPPILFHTLFLPSAFLFLSLVLFATLFSFFPMELLWADFPGKREIHCRKRRSKVAKLAIDFSSEC